MDLSLIKEGPMTKRILISLLSAATISFLGACSKNDSGNSSPPQTPSTPQATPTPTPSSSPLPHPTVGKAIPFRVNFMRAMAASGLVIPEGAYAYTVEVDRTVSPNVTHVNFSEGNPNSGAKACSFDFIFTSAQTDQFRDILEGFGYCDRINSAITVDAPSNFIQFFDVKPGPTTPVTLQVDKLKNMPPHSLAFICDSRMEFYNFLRTAVEAKLTPDCPTGYPKLLDPNLL